MHYIEHTFTPLIYFIYPVIQEYYLKIARKEKNSAMLKKKGGGGEYKMYWAEPFLFC